MAVQVDMKTDELLINMGPQHPSTHGVLRLLIRTDGEIVREADPCIGYLHRCAEKIAEKLSTVKFVPYTDRLDYLSSMSDNLGFCLAVESLLGMEVPPRAQVIRVMMSELNRIASHLVALGTYAIDLGAFTPFLYMFREREEILNLFEIVSGARLTYNYIRVGGVAPGRDVTPEFVDVCRKFLEHFPARLREYNDLLSYNRIFIERTANVGVLDPDLAVAYGVTGPNLRGSGVPLDVRRIAPYSGYEQYDFEIPVGHGRMGTVGDCWDRYWVRIAEMEQSARIVGQALDRLPEGDIVSKDLKKSVRLRAGEVYTRIENPRGELGYYLIGQEKKEEPYRLKIRGPSFCTLAVLPELCRDVLISDVVAILGSVDIVLGEVDR